MPWSTPTLSQVRGYVRDQVHGSLPGSDATIPNSVLRVLSDVQGGLCFLTLEYVDWLSFQLIPDTAETEWLDRHGAIWLVNADGTTGRKMATMASGMIAATGIQGVVVPSGQLLMSTNGVTYQTTALTIIGAGPTQIPATCLDAGSVGNQLPGAGFGWNTPVPGLNGTGVFVTMYGGADPETDDELRARVLQRIREPPMGGDNQDYVRWTLAVPGVTRAWCAPNEMGIGTVTVRFLMDDLRADDDGWPTYNDVQTVKAYLDTVRPVAVKDFWAEAPIKYPIEFDIAELTPDTEEVRSQIESSIKNMLFVNAAPGQTIFAAWKSYAVMSAPGVQSFKLTNNIDDVMPSKGHMAVLGNIVYEP
jgi:uncharacterized phage protein gp47/JayE